MRIQLTRVGKIFCGALAAAALFAGGYVAGQNRFGQPKTILHVVELKWSPAASDADKQKAIDGIKDMADQNSRHQEYLDQRRTHAAARFQCRLRHRIP